MNGSLLGRLYAHEHVFTTATRNRARWRRVRATISISPKYMPYSKRWLSQSVQSAEMIKYVQYVPSTRRYNAHIYAQLCSFRLYNHLGTIYSDKTLQLLVFYNYISLLT